MLGLVLLAACGPSDEQVAAFVGDWHLDEEGGARLGDAITLTLDADGTFEWTIEGCDFGGGGEGEWRVVGKEARLSPLYETFDWFHHPGYAHEVTGVVATLDGGELDVRATSAKGPGPFLQRWESGADLVDCGGGTP